MIGLFHYYRIISVYLVLLIHQHFWTMPCKLVRLTGVAVPLFAAMAGFLFANTLARGNRVETILVKKAKRILIPYAIWAFVYWVANNVVLDVLIKHEPLMVPGIHSWVLGGTACHLWFLPCLFLAFVMFTLGNHIFKRNEDSTSSARLKMIAFDAGILLFAALSQFINDLTSATLAGYVRIYFGRLVFYFAFGHLLALCFEKVKESKKSISVLVGCGLVIVGCANVAFNWIEGLVWNPFLLVAGLVFVANAISRIKVPDFAMKISDASMGVYLIHVLFTSAANVLLQKSGYSMVPPFIGFFLTLLVFALAYVSVRILPKKGF